MARTTQQEVERRTGKYEQLLARCKGLSPVPTAVAHPCDESSLAAAIEAAQARLIAPILVGPEARIRSVAERAHLSVGPYELMEAAHSHEAAAKVVELVRLARAELLMKGRLHTDELMAAVVKRDTGLRTDRRVSHVFIMDVPTYHKPLAITDAAVNIFPTLVVNAGSSSIKFSVYTIGEGNTVALSSRGQMEGIGVRPHRRAHDAGGTMLTDQSLSREEAPDVAAAMTRVGAWCRAGRRHDRDRFPHSPGSWYVHRLGGRWHR